MKRLFGLSVLAVAACLCASTTQLAAQGDKGKEVKGKGETKGEQKPSAAGVDFAKELGLAFPTLVGIGGRIEEARQRPDPVGLAAAARELAAAEKASGKTATFKAEQLMKEAIDLAKLRYDADELKAVADLVGAKNGKDLMELAKKAEKAEGHRGIRGQVHFDSRVNVSINCYVNGRYVGTMNNFGDLRYQVGDGPNDTTILEARAADGRYWSYQVSNNVNNFHWILNP
jgi:hypothetical protein